MDDATTDDGLPRGIGAPATRALTPSGYTTLDQLDGVSATALLAMHGVGPKAVRVLGEALAERGLGLADRTVGRRTHGAGPATWTGRPRR